MTHVGTKIIETERLILRRFTCDDAAAVFADWAGDPEVTEHLPWQHHKNVAQTVDVVDGWVSAYADPKNYNWAITLKGSDEPIGSVWCRWMDDEIGMIHTGYCIGKAWWGGGIVTEAYTAVVRYFFEEVGANRIEAYHDPRNPASGKVMQKCGLVYEGTLRKAAVSNRGIHDIAVYAILREDFIKNNTNG